MSEFSNANSTDRLLGQLIERIEGLSKSQDVILQTQRNQWEAIDSVRRTVEEMARGEVKRQAKDEVRDETIQEISKEVEVIMAERKEEKLKIERIAGMAIGGASVVSLVGSVATWYLSNMG